MTLDTLHDNDRRVLIDLAARLAQAPQEVLDRLTAAGDARVEGGRLVTLSLANLGLVASELRMDGLDALVALDVSGLGLEALGVDGLHRLAALRCADNRLPHLDVRGCPALERLTCSGNRLLVLDLRSNPMLRELDCAGNQLSGFLFPEVSRLEILRCPRNEILVLDLGNQPHLVELVCFRNPMVELRLSGAPRLGRLDCAHGELKTLPIGACPALVDLDCARNRLAALDLSPCRGLTRLDCAHNYLEALDVAALVDLRSLSCDGNQLRSLRLGSSPALDALSCAGNRLRTLDLSDCRALVEVCLSGNELEGLDMSSHASLCTLDASDNRIASLRVVAPGLAVLRLRGNPIAGVDVQGFPELWRLEVDPGVPVSGTEHQRWALAPPAADVAIEDMDAWALHAFARSIRGPHAEERLHAVVTSPRCDLGTALMVYWTSRPGYYLRYASRDEVEGFERPGWDLVETIERRVREGRYTGRAIWFDPRNDKQTRSVRGFDWTRETRAPTSPTGRAIPERMMAPSRPHP